MSKNYETKVIIAEKGDKIFNDVFESFTDNTYSIPIVVPSEKGKPTSKELFGIYSTPVGMIKDIYFSKNKVIGTLEIFKNNEYNVTIDNLKAINPNINFDEGATYRNPKNLKNLMNVTFKNVVGTTDVTWADWVNKYQIDAHNDYVDRLQNIIDRDFQNLSKDDISDLKKLLNYKLIKEKVRVKMEHVSPKDCETAMKLIKEN